MNLGNGLLGYAQFPNMSGIGGLPDDNGPASTDGVVVLYTSVGSSTVPFPGASPYDEGRTLTHELGHFFGLLHTFQGGCGVNNDYCDDTPRVASPTFGCPAGRTSCSGSVAMIENYMDYSDDACMNIFTLDQKARIQAVMANSPRRMELTSSTACSIPMPCNSCPLISAVSFTTGCDDNNTCFPIDDTYPTTFTLTHQSCASETGDGQFSVVFDPGGDNIVFGPFNYSTGTTTEVQIYMPYGAATGDEVGVYDNDFSCSFTYPNTFNPSPLPGCSNYSTPLMNCPPTWNACPGTSIAPATTGTATAQDCEGNTLTVSYSDLEIGVGLAPGESIIQRTWTSAPDIMGNTGSCIQIINRDDTTPPTIVCPATQTLVLGANCTAVLPNYTGMAMTSDNCGTPGVTQSPAAGTTVSGVGNTTVTLTANDGYDNTAQCSFTVTRVDNTPPTVQCFNQTITFNGEPSILLNVNNLASATDNCGVPTISISPTGISCESLGQTVPVTVTATDPSNNTATCISNITVAGLPCGWSQQPNGVNCANGNNIGYNPGTGVWTATSTNCYYASPFTSDATAFAQRTLCGDGSITAQVTDISGTALGWAGVVMRESNMAGAKKAQLMTNLSSLSRREFRTTTNGAANPQQFPSQDRYWLRIVRVGNQFSMYVSPNGLAWYFAGAQNIPMNACIQMGLVATNYQQTSTVTATFANVGFSGASTVVAEGIEQQAESIEQPYGFEVYPNPASGELNVDLSNYTGKPVRIEWCNLQGQPLRVIEIDEVQHDIEKLNLSAFPAGVYFLRLHTEGQADVTKRVVLVK
ncbi:MAG: HYR domain-containing protein [Saprospiraceae bacterium]|nr:HYR domain-containing protein [Saprospiraceae bacterium]